MGVVSCSAVRLFCCSQTLPFHYGPHYWGPSGLWVDSKGDIFFADSANHRVRKITASTNKISTVAGSSNGGWFSGDGGPATSAWLDTPQGVWVSSEGVLFIADTNNCRIRSVTSPSSSSTAAVGIISTFAGSTLYNPNFGYYENCGWSTPNTAATSSQLSYPQAVIGDSAGAIFISDTNNHVVLKVQSGILTVFAGKVSNYGSFSGDGLSATSATLNGPQGLWLTTTGSLLVADWGNHRIRSISLTGSGGVNNTIRTVMGDGNPAWKGDGGAALNASLYNPRAVCVGSYGGMYVTDAGNHRVRVVEGGTGIVSTIAGKDSGPATSSFLSGPTGMALDSSGNLFVTDSYYNFVRKLSLTTNIVTDIVSGLYYPAGLFIDTAGDLFIADFWNHRVQKIDIKTSTVSTAMSNLNYPQSVYVNTAGVIFVGDVYYIRSKNLDGIVTVIAGTGSLGSSPDGTPASSAQIGTVYHIFASSLGTIYFADYEGHKIRSISSTNNKLGTFVGNGNGGYSTAHENVAATSASLFYPTGFWFDSLGNCFIADSLNNRIRKVTAGLRRISTIAGNEWYGYGGDGGDPVQAYLYGPHHIVGDNAGNLYFTDRYNNQVRKIDLINNIISTFIRSGDRGVGGVATEGSLAMSSFLRDPYGVMVDSQRTVYFADKGNNKLRTIFDVAYPTGQPTSRPTTRPSSQPTTQPSAPTGQPTSTPSAHPTSQPSTPTGQPTSAPTQPTSHPTSQPTSQPSSQPSHTNFAALVTALITAHIATILTALI